MPEKLSRSLRDPGAPARSLGPGARAGPYFQDFWPAFGVSPVVEYTFVL